MAQRGGRGGRPVSGSGTEARLPTWRALRELESAFEVWEASVTDRIPARVDRDALDDLARRLDELTTPVRQLAGPTMLADLYDDPVSGGLTRSLVSLRTRIDDAVHRLPPLVDPPKSSPEGEIGATTPRLVDDARDPGRRSRIIGEVFTALGALAIVTAVYAIWGTSLAAATHQRSLRDEFDDRVSETIAAAQVALPQEQDSGILGGGSVEESTDDLSASPALPPPDALPGEPIAIVSIPTIGVDSLVVSGTRSVDLRAGPGHLRSTPLPGRVGNSVIFARRTTFGGPFRNLDDLEPGDPVEMTTPQGVFRYVVQDVTEVGDGDPGLIDGDTFSNRLTLVTSDGRWSTDGRVVAWAYLDREPAVTPTSADGRLVPLPVAGPDELGSSRSGTDWLVFVLWSQLLIGAYVGARALYRRWLPLSSWLVSTPVVLLVTFAWLDSATVLFPSVL